MHTLPDPLRKDRTEAHDEACVDFKYNGEPTGTIRDDTTIDSVDIHIFCLGVPPPCTDAVPHVLVHWRGLQVDNRGVICAPGGSVKAGKILRKTYAADSVYVTGRTVLTHFEKVALY